MAGKNGTGAGLTPAPVRMRFTAVPAVERITIEMENPDYDPDFPDRPETIEQTFRAYIRGDRCPIRVEIEVQAAWEEWRTVCITGETDKKGQPVVTYNYRAERELRRNLLRAVIEGLDQEQADVLGADGGPWADLLSRLGWYQLTTQADDEDDTDPEATAAPAEPSATKS